MFNLTDNFHLDLGDIEAARRRIQPYIRRTPLLRQPNLDSLLGARVYLKPEMLQYTGAFKLRGALSKILSLPEEQLKNGVITSSSGNHAQACAFAGQLLNIPVAVIIPEDAPQVKIDNAKAMGARVILWDRDYFSRWKKAEDEVKEHGYTIVHPYEDPKVMAGQGTMALEMLEDEPELDAVLVPIGGGGLISGVATAIKESKPGVRVIGVQAAASAAYLESRKAGQRVSVECLPTVADGLSCRQAGDNPFPVIEKYVDDIVAVDEEDILEAVRLLGDKAHLVAEPSACVAVAALLTQKVACGKSDKVACVLTSGNWDLEKIGKIYTGR